MEIRVAHVESIEDVNRQGDISVRLLGDDEHAPLTPVSNTTSMFAPPTGGINSKFTGFAGGPGKGAYILICNNPDDNKWYYLSTITGPDNYWDLNKSFGDTSIDKGPEGQFSIPFPASEDPKTSVYSHGVTPQKVVIESPQGGKLQISDSANEKDLQYHTKLESMTNKKFIADDVRDYIGMQNEHGDGIKVTSHQYEGMIGPGGRSAALQANQNIFIESDSGSLNADVKGGYQLNIRNQSANSPAMRPTPLDTKVGELNIESMSNSVNIRTYNNEFRIDPPSITKPSKGVFIDASQFMGVVQIKAGKGGVEIWSEGDIDFNCRGSFNVNAVGDINLTAKSTKAATYWGSQTNPAPDTHTSIGLGHINLNNPVAHTLKLKPTPNNDEQFPIQSPLT